MVENVLGKFLDAIQVDADKGEVSSYLYFLSYNFNVLSTLNLNDIDFFGLYLHRSDSEQTKIKQTLEGLEMSSAMTISHDFLKCGNLWKRILEWNFQKECPKRDYKKEIIDKAKKNADKFVILTCFLLATIPGTLSFGRDEIEALLAFKFCLTQDSQIELLKIYNNNDH